LPPTWAPFSPITESTPYMVIGWGGGGGGVIPPGPPGFREKLTKLNKSRKVDFWGFWDFGILGFGIFGIFWDSPGRAPYIFDPTTMYDPLTRVLVSSYTLCLRDQRRLRAPYTAAGQKDMSKALPHTVQNSIVSIFITHLQFT
jgi:hypothetical protein